jgi:hypothetical protein
VEAGASHYENDAGDVCNTTFEVDYEREQE